MSSTPPRSLPPTALRRLKRVRWIARWLDRAIAIPGTKIKLGLDAVIGLLPGGGDFLGTLLSMYVIVEAARLGAPQPLLVQMAVNVAVDLGLGTVPVAGDVVDIFWKSNARNVDLLEEHLESVAGARIETEPSVSWVWLIGLLILLLLGAIAAIALGIWVLSLIVGAIF